MKFLLLFSLLGFAGVTPAQTHKIQINVNKDNVALGGYDVVAYFTQNQALRGSQKYAAQYKGVNFWFTNAEHKKLFLQNPQKYLPQYGGWCAFAMATKGARVPSDPKTFKLYNGKLYLFFNDYYQGTPFNTIIPWNANEANLKQQADANWKKLNR